MSRAAKVPHRHKVLFAALGALALLLIGAGTGFVVLLSGAYGTEATRQHYWITYQILDVGLRYSVAARAEDIVAPDLTAAATIELGLVCYRRHCEQCHGAPGLPRNDAGKGMLPSPGALAQSARDWPAEHLYYVTKKGVRMTGMPAWEYRMSDPALWATTAYLKALPDFTHARYLEMAERSQDRECPRATDAVPYEERRARTTLRQYACENCHLIPGMVGPRTYVGPPLTDWSRRKLIAGVLPNTRENLIRWLVDPHGISPGTLMPDLGIEPVHAQEMATYLFGAD